MSVQYNLLILMKNLLNLNEKTEKQCSITYQTKSLPINKIPDQSPSFYLIVPQFYYCIPVSPSINQSFEFNQIQNIHVNIESNHDIQHKNSHIKNRAEIYSRIKNSALDKQCVTVHPKTQYTQNQYRNVMPNLIRLILNFVFVRQKSQQLLVTLFPDLQNRTINDFYKYTKRLKSQGNIGKNCYVSEKKLKDIFGISKSYYFGTRSVRKRKPSQETYKKMIRKLSYYYMNNILVRSILWSRKMNPQLRMVHLMKRKRLISLLRSQEQLQ